MCNTCGVVVIQLWYDCDMTVLWLWLVICAFSSFIPCVNYLLHELWNTDMRMVWYEARLWMDMRQRGRATRSVVGDMKLRGRATRSVAEFVHLRGGPYAPWRVTWTNMHHSQHHCIAFDLIVVCECGITYLPLGCGLWLICSYLETWDGCWDILTITCRIPVYWL